MPLITKCRTKTKKMISTCLSPRRNVPEKASFFCDSKTPNNQRPLIIPKIPFPVVSRIAPFPNSKFPKIVRAIPNSLNSLYAAWASLLKQCSDRSILVQHLHISPTLRSCRISPCRRSWVYQRHWNPLGHPSFVHRRRLEAQDQLQTC